MKKINRDIFTKSEKDTSKNSFYDDGGIEYYEVYKNGEFISYFI
jgi:hypothetical protein